MGHCALLMDKRVSSTLIVMPLYFCFLDFGFTYIIKIVFVACY